MSYNWTHNTFTTTMTEKWNVVDNPYMNKSNKKPSISSCSICGLSSHSISVVDSNPVCNTCKSCYFLTCSECSHLKRDYAVMIIGESQVCSDCIQSSYKLCDDCSLWRVASNTRQVVTPTNPNHTVCPVCWAKYLQCVRCAKYSNNVRNEHCRSCRTCECIMPYKENVTRHLPVLGLEEQPKAASELERLQNKAFRFPPKFQQNAYKFYSNPLSQLMDVELAQPALPPTFPPITYSKKSRKSKTKEKPESKNAIVSLEKNGPNCSISPYAKYLREACILGVEIEVHVKDKYNIKDAAEPTLNAVKEFAILKEDTSIKYGFEIVTAPATYEYHVGNARNRGCWDKFFDHVASSDYYDQEAADCGMHIHISRTALTPMQIGKMVVFIHSPANRGFIEVIAERGANKYNDFTTKKSVTDCFDRTGGNKEARYTAINLLPKSTIEIRIFKTVLNKSHVYKNLQFVKALIDYCSISGCSHKEAETVEGFLKFVCRFKKTYPFLHNFLKQKQLVTV